MDLPKTFDEFVDARKQGFIRAKEFKDNGGKLAGCLCSYTPQELLDAAGVATVGLCGTSSETIPDAEKVLPKNLCPLIKSTYGFAYSEKCPYDKLTNISDYAKGYLDGIMEAQLKVYGYYFIDETLTEEIIEEFKQHMPNYYECPLDNFLTDKITISQLYIGNKITALERALTIQTLSTYFSVDLYTGSNTSALPNVNNRGFAKTLTEMPIIFHESKINLNTTSKPIRSGIPLRVFDIMGCEGFVLSNYQPELIELFEPGVDFDYYTSMDELVEKTNYYLTHDAERKEISHNGFIKVSKSYNYIIRFKRLLDMAFSN